MLVNKLEISKFLELLIVKGDVENKEALLTITKDNISAKLFSMNKIVGISGIFKGEFEDMGDVGIDKLIDLKNSINMFTDEKINIVKQDNKILLTSDKDSVSIGIVLRAPDTIINILNKDKFNDVKNKAINNEFVLSKDIIAKLINYSTTSRFQKLGLTCKNNQIKVKFKTEQIEIDDKFKVDKVEDFNIKISSLFLDILSVCSNDVTLSIKDNSPIYVKLTNNNIEMEYVIAPIKG